MSIDFILPDIGEGIVECELVEWLVKEGEVIVEDQPIADVMTDKALVQIPSMYNGIVEKLHYKQGEIAKVHAPLFSMQVTADEDSLEAASVKSSASDQLSPPLNKLVPEINNTVPGENFPASSLVKKSIAKSVHENNDKHNNTKKLASPAVRRVAREMDINLVEVEGSGKKGRVYKDDVVAFSQQGSSINIQELPRLAVITPGKNRIEPIRGIKAIMAKSMQNSVSTIPHFTYCEEIDLTELVALRKELKAEYAKQDIKLTMMPFFMKAMSLALTEYPIVNSQVNEDCTELTYFSDHNVGMAVDSSIGLIVPNIKKVQLKTILELALDISRMTDNARSGRVAAADLKGGTITISNIGAIGGTLATPIINKPEAAIVALGKLQTLPRFNRQGEIVARSIMQVSWSGDHRIIDGGTIARFCNLWKSYLEKPSNMLVRMR